MASRFILAQFLSVVLCSAVSLSAEQPNVIVIFTDDHGWADLSCQDVFDDIATPNIDALATGGVRFTAGYVTAPQCVPSRAGLLSGQYQNRFGVESNGMPLDGFNQQLTIAERLKQAGYATGMTGKWHLGPSPQIPTHGFDDVYQKSANRPAWANYDLNGQDRDPGEDDTPFYHLDANSRAASAFIKRHHREPFFFYCAYRAPHVPLDAPAKYLRRFPGAMPERRRQALAMISAMDDGVGQIMTTLRRHELEEKTLIFLIGDNGAPLKIHKDDAPGGGAGWDGSLNEPFNGEKGMLTEGGIRVPFVAYWKGQIPAGTTYHHPVISLDVAATALALAGETESPNLDGVNLIPFLNGTKSGAPHEILFWRWIAQSAVRERNWKYLRGGSREYLFDLDADPEEKQNRITDHPEIAKRLHSRLKEWSQDLDPPGLGTRPMSSTWESYFDFYLDGKPAPPLRAKEKESSDTIQGWVVRGADIHKENQGLTIQASPKEKGNVFLARNGLKIDGPAQATITLKNENRGRVGLSWRLEGQKDFAQGQSVSTELGSSETSHQVTLELPSEQTIIHLRLFLPNGMTILEDVQISSRNGASDQTWTFREE